MFLIQDEAPSSKLDTLQRLFLEGVAWLNELFEVSARVIVFLYVQAFNDNFQGDNDALIVARTIFGIGILVAIAICMNNFFDAFKRYRKPLKLRPTLDAIQGPSAMQQGVSVSLWLIMSTGAIWIGTHLMAQLFLPVEEILTRALS